MKKLLMSVALLCAAAVSSAQVTFTCTAGKNFGGDEGIDKMFDGNTSTKYCGDAGDGIYALVTASEPVYVWGYDMTTANDNLSNQGQGYRLVKKWTLYGTNDASVASNASASGWVTLSDLGHNDMIQKENWSKHRFFCDKSKVGTAYKYFKIVLNEGNGSIIQLSEFSFCYETYEPATYNWSAGHSEAKDWSGNLYSDNDTKKMVDLNLGQKFEGRYMKDSWVTIVTGDEQPHSVKSYSFSTHDDGDNGDRGPRSWKIEGSNDNSNWTTIDEVTDNDNHIENKNYQTFEFTPSNVSDAFKYIKLTLLSMKNDNGGWNQVGEFHVVGACQTHSWEQTGGVEPTCVSEGGGELTCSVCGVKKLSDVIPATGIHSYSNGYCTVCNAPDPNYATLTDNYYQIGNKDQMKWFKAMVEGGNLNINARLTADIDMQSEECCIGLNKSGVKYAGEFDGQGHAIKNISYNDASMNQVGLFCLTEGAHIHNLALVNARLIGNANVGCIVGRAYGGTIERCAVLYSYAEGRDHVGTIAGDMNVKDGVGVTISNCYSNSASVSRQYQCGGLVGTSNGGILEKCIFLGTVDNPNGTSAGLISLIDSDTYGTTIRNNAIFPSSVSGSSAYAIVNTAGRSCSFADNYDFNQTEYIVNGAVSPKNLTQKDDQNGCQIDIEQISTQDTYTSLLGWDFTDTWKYVSGQYPILKWMTYSTNLILWSASDYDYFATQVNTNGQAKAKADVYADIDLSSGTHAPIGTTTYYYAGNFNGNGHSITLNIDATTGYQGLFGCVTDGARFSNFVVKGSVKGNGNTAALIGEAKGNHGYIYIRKVGLEATVTSTGGYTGAFVGNNWGGTIKMDVENSYNIGDVSGPSNTTVLCGWSNYGGHKLTNVYNIGEISGSTDKFVWGNDGQATFTNCYTTSTESKDDIPGLTQKISQDMITSGELCVALGAAFTQDLSQEGHPTFGSKTVTGGKWFNASDVDVYYNEESGNYTVYQLNLDEAKEDYNVPANVTAKNVTMARNLKADRWNTFCSPVALSSDNFSAIKELTAVTRNGDNYSMTFSDAAGDIEAGKPYMVKVAADKTELTASNVTVATAETPVTVGGLTFQGVFTNGNAPMGSFIISNNVFYSVDSDVTLKAFRGYITAAGGAGVKALDFNFDDDATGIEGLTPALSDGKGAIYNIAGQRLNKAQKGINIINGHKVLF